LKIKAVSDGSVEFTDEISSLYPGLTLKALVKSTMGAPNASSAELTADYFFSPFTATLNARYGKGKWSADLGSVYRRGGFLLGAQLAYPTPNVLASVGARYSHGTWTAGFLYDFKKAQVALMNACSKSLCGIEITRDSKGAIGGTIGVDYTSPDLATLKVRVNENLVTKVAVTKKLSKELSLTLCADTATSFSAYNFGVAAVYDPK